jgi:hypothetical protein
MKTITKDVYSFAELIELEKEKKVSSSVVEKVRSKLSDFNSDDSWYECTLEKWTSILNQIGFKDPKIQFSGFSSQGDGASFEASLDSEKLIWFQTHVIKGLDCIKPTKRTGTEEDFFPYVVHKLDGSYGYDKDFAKLKRLQEVIYGKVVRTGHRYSHENTCSVELDRCDFPERMDGVLNDWETSIEELRRDLCRVIYKCLEKEYYWQMEDEQLIEMDENNNYQWDETGRQE